MEVDPADAVTAPFVSSAARGNSPGSLQSEPGVGLCSQRHGIGGIGPMKIRPLRDRIIVKRIEEEETSKGGIIIPDTAKEKPQEGKVIAVGKGMIRDDGVLQKLDVKKGNRVLFGKFAGTEVTLDGEEHLIISEDDVLGIVE
jgi:chaperonin GroES